MYLCLDIFKMFILIFHKKWRSLYDFLNIFDKRMKSVFLNSISPIAFPQFFKFLIMKNCKQAYQQPNISYVILIWKSWSREHYSDWQIFLWFTFSDLKLWRGHASVKHLSRPMILGFGHPSGALEDGARGNFFYMTLHVVGIWSKCYIKIKAKKNNIMFIRHATWSVVTFWHKVRQKMMESIDSCKIVTFWHKVRQKVVCKA